MGVSFKNSHLLQSEGVDMAILERTATSWKFTFRKTKDNIKKKHRKSQQLYMWLFNVS
jgi:hypothetical protein